MFLATQLMDESRHIDVFLRRAGKARGVSSVTTSRSLLALLQLEDFTEAAFLLSVLGEGTFLDLLRFVEVHAPDEVTADLARRTRADEARHVHFGIAHVRHALSVDSSAAGRLEAAVRRRAAALHGIDGVPAPIQDAILPPVATSPPAWARARGLPAAPRGHARGRLKRLEHAGFTAAQAELLSGLQPNFMRGGDGHVAVPIDDVIHAERRPMPAVVRPACRPLRVHHVAIRTHWPGPG